jgi:hypothetical protein
MTTRTAVKGILVSVLKKVVSLSALLAVGAGCQPNLAQSQTAGSGAKLSGDAARIAWQKMPLLSPQAKEGGVFPGGEGGQWPRGPVTISKSDPNFMLLPIDVGGLYRSVDGGKNWTISMRGWHARGANGFAIDPRNANRVLGIGGNSMDYGANWGPSPHGVYLSTNKARSWKHVVAVRDGLNGQIAFDASSYDAAKKFCTRAYYATPLSGLLRSDDGGQSWKRVSDIAAQQRLDEHNPAQLAVHPTRGWVYIGGKDGLWVSKDRGQTFHNIYKDGSVWGVALNPKSVNEIYLSGSKGVLKSSDGAKFSALPAAGIARKTDEPVRNIAVSPANARRMLVWVSGENWQWRRYVSHDGGASFQLIKIEAGTSGRDVAGDPNATPGGFAVLPLNVRNGYFAWHPTDANIVFGLGGDWVTKSNDGGKTFVWWNNGNNGIMVGGGFGFSSHDPNTVFMAFQDYNGAFTTDGGATWNYRDVSGHGWGGHAYGGFAVDKEVMWYGDSEGWGPPRRLRISRDGGTTWNFAKGPDGRNINWEGAEVSFADPNNSNTLFASNWRSTDKGVSWQKMSGCDGVYGATPDGTLFGRKGRDLVTSDDAGATWNVAATATGDISDVAYDEGRNRFYIASEDRLKVWENGAWRVLDTPKNQRGGTRVTTVAIDAAQPDIVYVGGPNNIVTNGASIARSTDAGATWMNLTTGDGPHEVSWIRVHPQTREAWAAGQCFGMWRIAAPSQLGAAPPELANAAPAPSVPAINPVG